MRLDKLTQFCHCDHNREIGHQQNVSLWTFEISHFILHLILATSDPHCHYSFAFPIISQR